MQRFQYCRDLISKEGFEKYNKFCEFLYTIYCRTGERMVRKGEQGTRFYLILQGTVSLVSYKPRNRKAQLMMDLEKVLFIIHRKQFLIMKTKHFSLQLHSRNLMLVIILEICLYLIMDRFHVQ